jgi:hypothetical protein
MQFKFPAKSKLQSDPSPPRGIISFLSSGHRYVVISQFLLVGHLKNGAVLAIRVAAPAVKTHDIGFLAPVILAHALRPDTVSAGIMIEKGDESW